MGGGWGTRVGTSDFLQKRGQGIDSLLPGVHDSVTRQPGRWTIGFCNGAK